MAEPAPYSNPGMSNLLTPDQIARNRKLGETLMLQGMSTEPVGHWTQGLARVLQAGVGRSHMTSADEAQQARQQAMMGALQSSPTFAGLSPGDRAMMGMDPDMMRAVLPKVFAEKLDPTAGLRRQALELDIGFKRQMQPYQLYSEYQQQQLRDKQLQGEKFGRVKSDEDLYVQDPSQPGGVRFIDRPNAGAPGAKKFAEEAAKQAAERYATIIKHGDTQPTIVFDLLRLQELSDAIGNPNAYNTFVQKYGGWMKSVGINPSVMPNLEQFSALVSKMAPNLRPPGSGATSDFDLQQYINSLPQFMQTAEGRKAIINHQRAVAAYAMQQKSIAQQVMLGNLTREEGERRMNELPDPHAIWKQLIGRTEKGPQFKFTARNGDGRRIGSNDGVNWEPIQ